MLEYGDELNAKYDAAIKLHRQGYFPGKHISWEYETHFCNGNTIPRISFDIKFPELPSLPDFPLNIPIPSFMPTFPGMNFSIPGLNLPNFSLPSLPSIPSLMPDLNLSLPNFNLSLPNIPSLPMPTFDFPSITIPTFSFPSLPDIPPFPDIPELPSLPSWEICDILPDAICQDYGGPCGIIRKLKNDPNLDCSINWTLPELNIKAPQIALEFDLSLPDWWREFVMPRFPDLPDFPEVPGLPSFDFNVGAGVSILFPKGLHTGLPFDQNSTIPMTAEALCNYWEKQVLSGQLPFLTAGSLQWPVKSLYPATVATLTKYAEMGPKGEQNTGGFSALCKDLEAPLMQLPMTFTTPWGTPGIAYLT